MKKVLISLLLICFASCKNEEATKAIPEGKKPAIQKEQNTSILESFSRLDRLPEEVDGAGCSFAIDKKNHKEDKDIYVDNLDSICYIKVKGRFIRLELVEDTSLDTLSIDRYSKKFRNEDYQLSIDLKGLYQTDSEATYYKGFMILKSNDGSKEKTNLYGLCGC